MSRQPGIITPEHFVVAPELLGLPLATPSRRAWAMAIDLLLIAILVKAGGVLLGIVGATVLFRAAKPDARGGFIRRSVRGGLRIAGALLLFLVVYNGFGKIKNRITGVDRKEKREKTEAATDVNLNLSGSQLAALYPSFLTLRGNEDTAAVEKASVKLLETARDAGAAPADLRSARDGIVALFGRDANPAKIRAVDKAIERVAGENKPIAPDTALHHYAAALAAADSTTAPAYRDSLKQLLAGSDIEKLEKRAKRLDQRGDSLQKELDNARKARGIRTFLAGAADDLGVGFGWSAVYFTAFLALWRGQTPGKKLAGVRVLRLDGEPLGWWMSFERFGGYAASFSVGLMGFLQILCDRNRQGLHDKACETVVVRS